MDEYKINRWNPQFLKKILNHTHFIPCTNIVVFFCEKAFFIYFPSFVTYNFQLKYLILTLWIYFSCIFQSNNFIWFFGGISSRKNRRTWCFCVCSSLHYQVWRVKYGFAFISVKRFGMYHRTWFSKIGNLEPWLSF